MTTADGLRVLERMAGPSPERDPNERPEDHR